MAKAPQSRNCACREAKALLFLGYCGQKKESALTPVRKKVSLFLAGAYEDKLKAFRSRGLASRLPFLRLDCHAMAPCVVDMVGNCTVSPLTRRVFYPEGNLSWAVPAYAVTV